MRFPTSTQTLWAVNVVITCGKLKSFFMGWCGYMCMGKLAHTSPRDKMCSIDDDKFVNNSPSSCIIGALCGLISVVLSAKADVDQSIELSQNLRQQTISHNNGQKNLIFSVSFLSRSFCSFLSLLFHPQALFTSFVSREVMDRLSLIL